MIIKDIKKFVFYPLVSIIILNYNGIKHLKTCLDSVLSTNYPNFEVIVVDNGSTDGSAEFVKDNYPMVRLLRLSRNIYTTGGYMAGVLVAKGRYVAILNNDVEVDSNWLKPLVNSLEKMPWVAAADAKYRSFYDRDRFENSAAAGRWIDYFGNNFTRGVEERDLGQYDKTIYIMGVLTIFRRDILIKIGGFDLSYIFGYEDIDIGWRLYLAGYKVLYVPQAVIYHKSGASTKEGRFSQRPRPEFFYLNKRNRLITLIKNYSIYNFLTGIAVTLQEYYLSVWYFLFSRRGIYALQLIRAIVYIFLNLRKIVSKRILIQQIRVRSDSEVRRYMVPYYGDIAKVLYKN
ncbi:MAG: glycosyltransferase [Candidatus Bathyarchaeia archaeon]|nr:glycosyltransferase [Candidatus Bathyarchaeota archaeon]